MPFETIYALSSGRPPAAIAVIRISGPRAHDAGTVLAGTLPVARLAELRTLRDPAADETLDEAIVLRFDGPASATGEDLVELQCHGGRAVVDAILAALGTLPGLRLAMPGEFTRRAFENGRVDLTEAEGLADLLEAETQSQRKAALALAEGGLRRQIAEWNDRLLGISAAVERAIDYDEEDEPFDAALTSAARQLADELELWLCRPRVERLKDGILVVVAGPPNAGKSSLINAIVGEDRVIVSDVPGTTRDHVEVPISVAGIPMRLTDTAGLRMTDDQVEALGVARAQQLIDRADIIVWLGGVDDAPEIPNLILVQSKSDLAGFWPVSGAMRVSAVTGDGLGALLERIKMVARTLLPEEGAIALNRRQADLIGDAASSLARASRSDDFPIFAEELRRARDAFDRLTGRQGVASLLDALFSRFCLGK